ncbi:MAG: calcium/sodium antiporter [Lachnospiraceae bacterium]|nr:calcium/sodium antiporter [Lachnospiraceae bacterium]
MLVPVIWFLIGLVLLIKGGDWFVDGATGIAERFHLPELLIGATVVSIGTTLPEVMVSATSAASGHSQIAYGNAIGSIICNTSLIAAVTIAVRPGKVERKTLILPVCFFFIAAAFYAGIAYTTGTFQRADGILLLGIFLVYMAATVRQMTKGDSQSLPESSPELPGGDSPDTGASARESRKSSLAKELLLLIAGAAVIAVGADLLVDNGTLIAEGLGVPESVIALTFVALGTSLPELVTAITSLIKGHGALSLGNVIGANLFNLVLVCGISITLKPFEIPASSMLFGRNASLVLDIPVMLAVMLILTVPALVRKKLSRVQGIGLLAIYAGYCVIQFAM